jgi:hypothetical protein
MPSVNIRVPEFFHRARIKFFRVLHALLGDCVSTRWNQWEDIDIHFSQMSQEGQINTFRRSCLVLETMDYQGGDAKSFSKELARLGIIEKPLGRPIKPLGYANSLNLGRQYQHLNQWSSQLRRRIQEVDRIVEFGGGFGMMCWLVFQLGFTGTYVIIDNRGTTSLQMKYLQATLSNEQYSKVKWFTNLESLSPQLTRQDLFVALWSASETPDDMLNEVLRELETVAPSLLIAFQNSFKGRDNLQVFRQYKLAGSYALIEKSHSHYVTN